tara:strand:- start:50 stop:766 length:717 start_codon:yes stop_codon:yes gene_type:complete
MLNGKHIAAMLRDARFDTDLGLIYGIWPEEDRGNDVMRPSGHLAIRKAASSLDRIGDALVRHLAQDRLASYRTLPEIKPTTRVRRNPQRFWLEFDLEARHGERAAGDVLFVEFSKTEVRVGIRSPIISTFEKSSAEPLSHPISMDTRNWLFEQRKPPAAPGACSIDLNTWLSGRVAAQKQEADFRTLSKACPNSRPLMKNLIAGLSEASTLYDTIKGGQVNQTSLATRGLESQHAALT